MNNNVRWCLVLIVLVSIISVRHFNQHRSVKPIDIPFKPSVPIEPIIPIEPSVPVLKSNIVNDNFDGAVDLAQKYNKKLMIIFGAEWCPYCQELKKDLKNIKQLNQYIICILDIDNKSSNGKAISLLKPKSLPTSIYLDKDLKELSRKTGYKNKDYLSWLNGL